MQAVVLAACVAVVSGCTAGVKLPDRRPDNFRVELTAMRSFTPDGTDTVEVDKDGGRWHRELFAADDIRTLTLQFRPDDEQLDALYAAACAADLHMLWTEDRAAPSADERLKLSVRGGAPTHRFDLHGTNGVNDEPRLRKLVSQISDLGSLATRRPLQLHLYVDPSCFPIPVGAVLQLGRLRHVRWVEPAGTDKPLELELIIETDEWKDAVSLQDAEGRELASIELETEPSATVRLTLQRAGDAWEFVRRAD